MENKSSWTLCCLQSFQVAFQYTPRELETHVHTNTCTPVTVAASFLVATKQEQSKCPSIAERINNVMYTHNGILLNSVKE